MTILQRTTAFASSSIGHQEAETASPVASKLQDGGETYKRPAGLSLMFCSRAEIEAAPQEEREAYYRIVEGICATPEKFGVTLNSAEPRKGKRLSDDEFDDNMFSIENGDGEIM